MKSLKLRIVCVGKPGRLLSRAIAEYEARSERYVDPRVLEVKGGQGDAVRVRATEAEQSYRAGPTLRGMPQRRLT